MKKAKPPDFVPIQIVLETEQEVQSLGDLARCVISAGKPSQEVVNFATKLINGFSGMAGHSACPDQSSGTAGAVMAPVIQQAGQDDVLNEKEVAAILDCEPNTVQENARKGLLPAVKFGRSWRFPRIALLQSLNEMALTNKAKVRPPRPAPQPLPVVAVKSRRTPLPRLAEPKG